MRGVVGPLRALNPERSRDPELDRRDIRKERIREIADRGSVERDDPQLHGEPVLGLLRGRLREEPHVQRAPGLRAQEQDPLPPPPRVRPQEPVGPASRGCLQGQSLQDPLSSLLGAQRPHLETELKVSQNPAQSLCELEKTGFRGRNLVGNQANLHNLHQLSQEDRLSLPPEDQRLSLKGH